MHSVFGGIVVMWLLYKLSKWVIMGLTSPWRKQLAMRRKVGRVADYRLTQEQNRILALAHPMAFHAIAGGFANNNVRRLDSELIQLLRPLTLHHFGLRTDLSESAVHQQLPQIIKARWFRQDLDHQLTLTDQPRDAMAFACVRAAFFVRSAALLGWIDEKLQWKLLQLNAARAHDCFTDWSDFAHAYARGRTQWVDAGRSDALGQRFEDAELTRWLTSRWHPWGKWPWLGER